MDEDSKTPVNIQQDANIQVAELDSGKTVELELSAKRQAYLLCLEGSVTVASDKHGEEVQRVFCSSLLLLLCTLPLPRV